MNLRELLTKIHEGEVTVEMDGHRCNPFIDRFQKEVESVEKHRAEYQALVDKGVKKTKGDHPVDPANMVKMYDYDFEVRTGNYIRSMEIYCFDCGSRMYPIYMEEDKTIRFINSGTFWNIADASGKKYDFVATVKDVPKCSAKELRDTGVLRTEIECPSGHLIFKNFFRDKYFYEDDDKVEYGGSDICCVGGRYDLMKNLAERNIGYGQMGNTSVNVYSNDKNEVIIGSEGCFLDNDAYYKSHPEKLKEDRNWDKETEQYRAFETATKDMELKGDICLDVWRWQCADVVVLATKNEKWKEEMDEGTDVVELHLKPGTYVIEHYYDFPANGDYLHSKIYKK